MHPAYQVVGLQHTSHGVGQAQRHCHGQSFRHRHHDQRYCQHERLERVGEEVHRGEGSHGIAVGMQERHRPADDDQQGQHIADFGDQVTQPLQLFVQRCLHAVIYLCRLEHPAVLRAVTHGEHLPDAVTLHDLGASHHVVRGERRLLVEVFRVD